MTESDHRLDKDTAEYVAWTEKELHDAGNMTEASAKAAETEYNINLFKKISNSPMIKSLYESALINARFEGNRRLKNGLEKLISWTPQQRYNAYNEGPYQDVNEFIMYALDNMALCMAERELNLEQKERTVLLSPPFITTNVVPARDNANRSIYRMGKVLSIPIYELTRDQQISANVRGLNITFSIGTNDQNIPQGYKATRYGKLTISKSRR